MIAFTNVTQSGKLLLGTEKFPVVGNALTESELSKIIPAMKGLRAYWHCLEKAKLVVSMIGRGTVMLGSLRIFSEDLKSIYGYEWVPPTEFHAWVKDGNNIIDVSLPGAIQCGLETCDDFGPFLVGREPVILAGKSLLWTTYRAYEELI